MRWLLVAMLAACADPTGLGEASATPFDTAASATVIVANGTDGVQSFRVWRIEIGEDLPGTDCKNRGDALIQLDVFTQLSSAPRGEILLTMDVPPFVFPAVAVAYANGVAIDGLLTIDAASTTGLFGSFRGRANIDSVEVTVDATFAAPTCGV